VLQGERQFARDNKPIGKFKLDDIPPAPRGVPQIEVTFDIDANGILHVGAKDLGTGREQKITITASSGLSQEEIERMRKDADSHADEDKKRREEVESRNEADNAVYRSEKMLKESGDKLPAGAKEKIEAALKAAKDALNGTDSAAIKTASERLNETWQTASAELYKNTQAGGQAGTAEGEAQGSAGESKAGGDKKSAKDEGPIIDAEVVDEKKG
jgi:molecular chaperone DnaK